MELRPFGVGDARLSVQIAPDADLTASPTTWWWTQITDDVRVEEGIEVDAGRADEGTVVGPTRVTLTVDNRSGNYSTRNPLGAWYGQLHRNTPLRVRVWLPSSPEVTDAFGRTVAAGWGTSDTGQAWTSTGAGGTVSSTDYSVGSGVGQHSLPAASAYRFSYLPLSTLPTTGLWDDVDLAVTVTLSTTAAGGALEPAGLMARVQDVATYYLGRLVINPTTQAITVELSRNGTTSLATGATGITHAAGQAIRARLQVVGSELRMRAWVASGTEPSVWHATATDTVITAPGGVGVRSGVAAGNTTTKPVVFSYDGLAVGRGYTVGAGYVAEWPARWDKSTRDATAPIQASGILRRLAQRKLAKRSPMRREIDGAARANPGLLLAYWPIEDDKDATQAASALTSGSAMQVVGGTVAFGAVDTARSAGFTDRYGTSALPQLASGGVLTGTVPPTTLTAWTVTLWIQYNSLAVAPDTVMARWYTPGGTFVRWDLVAGGTTSLGSYWVNAYDAAGTVTKVLTYTSGGNYSTLQIFRVDAAQNGTGVDLRFWVAGNLESSTTRATSTLGPVRQVLLNPDGYTQTATDMAMGHVQVWGTKDAPHLGRGGFDSYGMFTAGRTAWQLESAHDRIERSCGEDLVPIVVTATPTADLRTMMGSQPDEALLPILRECETADGGLLYEQDHGLAYQPRSARYNAPIALSLDVAAGHLAAPPEPTDDDQQLLNDVTVQRVGGSSARHVDQDSIAANDQYDANIKLNVYLTAASPDAGLEQHAAWRVALGTVAELRYPRLPLDFARNPSLLPDWLTAGGIGSRLTVTGLPAQVPDDVDVFVEGYSMKLGYAEWTLEANCSQASPWRIWTVEDATYGRVDTGGSQLAGAITSSATTFTVNTTSGPRWTTTPADFPLDIEIAGEQITVTSISGTGTSQTFTVVRAVNGIVKTHSAGTAVRLWRAPVVAL